MDNTEINIDTIQAAMLFMWTQGYIDGTKLVADVIRKSIEAAGDLKGQEPLIPAARLLDFLQSTAMASETELQVLRQENPWLDTIKTIAE